MFNTYFIYNMWNNSWLAVYNLCERDSLPEYARGTYDNGMVNACVNPKFQLKRLYTASHELFHILYMKYVLNKNILYINNLNHNHYSLH